MKKIFSVILSILYFSLSSGAMVNFHYCGGELASIQINSGDKSCCCGTTEISSSCCQDENVILDIDVDEKPITSQNLLTESLFFISYFNSFSERLFDIEIEEDTFINYKIPPPKLEQIYKLNCSFTYYG